MLGIFDLTVFILSQWSQHSRLLLVSFFCDDKFISSRALFVLGENIKWVFESVLTS